MYIRYYKCMMNIRTLASSLLLLLGWVISILSLYRRKSRLFWAKGLWKPALTASSFPQRSPSISPPIVVYEVMIHLFLFFYFWVINDFFFLFWFFFFLWIFFCCWAADLEAFHGFFGGFSDRVLSWKGELGGFSFESGLVFWWLWRKIEFFFLSDFRLFLDWILLLFSIARFRRLVMGILCFRLLISDLQSSFSQFLFYSFSFFCKLVVC